MADRFHLLINIGEVVEQVLSRKHICLLEAAAAVDRLRAQASGGQGGTGSQASSKSASEPLTRSEQAKQAHRARRLDCYQAVIALHEQGASLRAISREIGVARATVRRFIRAGSFRERVGHPKRPAILTPYEPYLRERWTSGIHNACALWKEIRDQGFSGSASLVWLFVSQWRSTPGRSGPTPRRVTAEQTGPTPPAVQPTAVLSPRRAKWLLLRDIDDLDHDELAYRDQLLKASEKIGVAMLLANKSGRIVREQDLTGLDPWLQAAETGDLAEFQGFLLVLLRDLPAVQAALTYDWSNGQAEGQINRLKMLKRQMYGRASLDLLKRSFVQAA